MRIITVAPSPVRGMASIFIRHAVAFDVCARYKYLKESVEKAADYIIHNGIEYERRQRRLDRRG